MPPFHWICGKMHSLLFGFLTFLINFVGGMAVSYLPNQKTS